MPEFNREGNWSEGGGREAMSKPVITFIIMPPEDIMSAVKASKEWFEANLEMEFSGYEFKIVDPVEAFERPDFVVMPIMNYEDANGDSRMCEKPEGWLMENIYKFCRGFNLSPDRRLLQ